MRSIGRTLVLFLALAAGARFATGEGGVNWAADLESAKKAAAEQKRVIFANFWAEW